MVAESANEEGGLARNTLNRIKIYLALLAVALSCLVAAASWWGWSDSIDKLAYDQFLQFRPKDPPADVIVVAIDEYSLSHIGEWPWSRRYHAELINRLTDAGASAIGFDVVFAETNPMDPEGDKAFSEALIRSGKVVLPVYIDRTQLGGQLIEVLPHPLFAEHARMGHVNTELDHDGIVRHFFQFEGIGDAFWAHFATVVAEIAVGYQQPDIKEVSDKPISPLVNVRKLPQLIPFLGGVGSFQQVSFYDVIANKLPARLFKDRVVFVGATSISLGDLLPTPVTVQGEQMPGVEINATIFDAARSRGFIVAADPLIQLALSVLVVLVTVFLIPRVAGRTSLLFIISTITLLLITQAILVLHYDYWIPLASAIIGQCLVYPLWTVLRLDQTIRYLQKQLFALREELGHQSLVESQSFDTQTFIEKLNAVLEIVGVRYYQLTANDRLIQETTHLNQLTLKKSKDLSYGPSKSGDEFYCYYDIQNVRYLLIVPVKEIPHWNELKEAYITGFFENEVSKDVLHFEGTYDLVFKYLNEVRASQVEVNKARLLFEFCVNEMNDGVIIADEFGGVLFVNRLAQSYLSEDDSSSEKPGTELLPGNTLLLDLLIKLHIKNDDSNWNELILDVIAERKSREVEVETATHASLLVNLTYLDVLAHRSNLVIINLYDISRIREAQRLRNETIDFLSHDMRSPMVSLLAIVNQKRSQGENDEFLNQIESYASKNLYFAEQFLQLARVESDQPIQTYEVDFEAIIQNAIDEVHSQAQAKQIRLCFESQFDICWVKANGELMERAVVNLMTNAIKYGPEDSNIDLELKPYGENLLILVRDYGVGIPKEQQAYLFAPYQRAHGKAKVQEKGAGLGLRFVDVTVKRHGGELFFNSKPGRTEFGFTLPILDVE